MRRGEGAARAERPVEARRRRIEEAGHVDRSITTPATQRAQTAEGNAKRYFELLSQARKLGESIVEDGGQDPDLMNYFAWTILTDEDVSGRDHTRR